MDGHFLTEEQFNYLDLTSEELNKMVDKRHYQARTNLLDREFIHNVEVCIADEILSNYFHARKKVIKNRKKFLSLRSKKKSVRNERFFKRMYETELNSAQLHKKKRVYMLLKKIIQKILDSPERMEELQKKVKKVAKMFKEMKCNTEKINTMYGMMTVNELKHFRHPHSKILKKMGMKEPRKRRSNSVEVYKRNPYLEKIKKTEKKFRLNTSNVNKVSNRKQFMKCYSGGPLFNNNNGVRIFHFLNFFTKKN